MSELRAAAKKSTELQILNQTRWQRKGQLLRTASLLYATVKMYPRLNPYNYQGCDIFLAITALRVEAAKIDADYIRAKKNLLAKGELQ